LDFNFLLFGAEKKMLREFKEIEAQFSWSWWKKFEIQFRIFVRQEIFPHALFTIMINWPSTFYLKCRKRRWRRQNCRCQQNKVEKFFWLSFLLFIMDLDSQSDLNILCVLVCEAYIERVFLLCLIFSTVFRRDYKAKNHQCTQISTIEKTLPSAKKILFNFYAHNDERMWKS
jgi:hypothetical protein